MLIKKPFCRKKLLNFIAGFFFLIFVVSMIIQFHNFGGEAVLKTAQDFLSGNADIDLSFSKISGNPLRGYYVENLRLADSEKNIFVSVDSIACKLDLKNLIKGKFEISKIHFDGAEFNVYECLEKMKNSNELSKFRSSESIEHLPIEKILFSNSKFNSRFGTFSAENISLNTKLLDLSFKGKFNSIDINGAADLEKTSGAFEINKADINFGKGKILATGGILKSESENDRYLDLHGSVQSINLKELVSLWNTTNQNDFEGNLSLNIEVSGSTRNPKISGTGNYKGSKISGVPVESFSANFTYANKILDIDNIQAYALNIPINGDILMRMANNKKPSFEIRLEGSESNLEELDSLLKIAELRKLKGVLNSINVNLKGSTDNMNGIVNFYGKKILYDGNLIKDFRGQIKFARSPSAIINGKFNFEGSQGYIQGDIKSAFINPECNLIVKVVDLEFEKIRQFVNDYDDNKISEKVSVLFNIKGKILNPEIFGEFSGVTIHENLPFRVSESKITFLKSQNNTNNLSGGI